MGIKINDIVRIDYDRFGSLFKVVKLHNNNRVNMVSLDRGNNYVNVPVKILVKYEEFITEDEFSI